MPSGKHRRPVCSAFASTLYIFVFASLSYADDLDDQPIPQTTDSNGDSFTLMNVEAMNAYRDERRNLLAESLAQSDLSSEHQDIVANAMAKLYVGIPVSSYTYSARNTYLKYEPTETTANYLVSVDGHIGYDDVPFTHTLTILSPFTYIPPDAIVSESGKLLDETDSSATFAFDIEFELQNDIDEDMIAEISDKMKWDLEFTINKANQSPELVVIKLNKPVRKRFRFKIQSVRLEFHYSLVEKCDCFAVH